LISARWRGRLAVEPDTHDGAIKNQSYDRLIGQRPLFQASQLLFTLRRVRLTVPLPTVPPNRAASA
jgi:hypothetical protein